MNSTVKKTEPLAGFVLFNPKTGKFDTPLLTIEVDPFTRLIIHADVHFPSAQKGNNEND